MDQPAHHKSNEAKHPVRVQLHKDADMVYFSQLDIAHLLERALRRTNLPIYYTKGFNPRVKLSFSNALKLGTQGSITVTFYFTTKLSNHLLIETLSPQLPTGLTLTESDL